MKTEKRFATAMAKLAEVYRVELTPVMVEAYREALIEWPIEGLEAGARAIIKESKFFPRPVEWSDAAEDWLKERKSLVQSQRLMLEQSNEPPLTKEDVQKLIDQLNEKLDWPR